jgi:pimeloyl-ACP methyl ester carboxylesterase
MRTYRTMGVGGWGSQASTQQLRTASGRASTRADPRARLISVERPETKYVAVGDSEVAYQVVGSGSCDVLWMYPLGSHVDLVWQIPPYAESVDRLCRFSRVIILDRRGSGASGPAPGGAVPSWKAFTEDIGAVLDASQSERVAIVATRETGQIAILYAGMHPERVSELVLLNTTARYLGAWVRTNSRTRGSIHPPHRIAGGPLKRQRWTNMACKSAASAG